jgi:surfeit locus 1 family protein
MAQLFAAINDTMRTLTFKTSRYTYHLSFRPGFLLLCLSFFVLMCNLGVWQLHRYHFKKNLQDAYQAQQSQAPTSLSQLDITHPANLQFRKIHVEGEFLNNQTVFLQNQFHENQVGFDVLTPLQIPGEKKLLLVDRGWVSDNGRPNVAPSIPAVLGQQKIIGDIKNQNEFQFILGAAILRPNARPLLIQKVDVKALSDVTKQDYFPFYVRLSPGSPNGFVRDWIVTTVTPERHMGYAIQWFLMAGILLIAYFATVVKREKLL